MSAERGLLVVAGLCLVGLLIGRLVRGRLSPLRAGDTGLTGGWAAIVGFSVHMVCGSLLLWAFPGSGSLAWQLGLQAVSAALAAAVMLALVAPRPGGVRALGLRPHRGPPATLVALGAWLAFYPVFLGVAWLNHQVLNWLGHGADLQEPLRLFLADEAVRKSPVTWLAVVLLLPAFEELIFRGGLHGALRRTLHPGLAVALSALLFGIVHEPAAAAPAAALGAMLAILYERTGSLAAPLAFHALHNGSTLLLATFAPELLT